MISNRASKGAKNATLRRCLAANAARNIENRTLPYTGIFLNFLITFENLNKVKDKNGKITFTKWGAGRPEGVFSFEAYDEINKKDISASGHFTYKMPVNKCLNTLS